MSVCTGFPCASIRFVPALSLQVVVGIRCGVSKNRPDGQQQLGSSSKSNLVASSQCHYSAASFVRRPSYYGGARTFTSHSYRSLAATVQYEFPGLARCRNSSDGHPNANRVILADGAGGSQIHEGVVDAMVEQMTKGQANMGGNYDSSRHAHNTMIDMRTAMADFLKCRSDEIVLGASMSALTYHVSRALQKSNSLQPGDNVVLDPMSHGANVWTWAQLAKTCGCEIRWLKVGDGLVLNSQQDVLSKLIDEKTRLVAVGYASNGVGSVHDVRAICTAARDMSKEKALSYVDAVHYAPHGHIDVKDVSCDFLVCSPYKFFGPHSGILYGRKHVLQKLSPDRLDCQDDGLPREDNCHMSRWEVGTQNYEAAAGITAAVNYLAGLGKRFGGATEGSPRAARLSCAWHAIMAHERDLTSCFLEGAAAVPGLHVVGIRDAASQANRTPTFALAKDGLTAKQLADALCQKNIWCTSGNHYAGFWAEHTGGLAQNDTGMARLGFLHYNTVDEVQRVLQVLADL